MKKRIWLLNAINIILFYATLALGLGSLVPGNWLPGVGVFSILFPLLLFPHMIMVFIWLRLQPKRALKNIICIALLLFPVLAQAPLGKGPSSNEDLIRVASYNVRAFYQFNGAANEIGQWTQREGIDVLCVQEMRRSAVGDLYRNFPNRVYAPKNRSIGTAIYSKYPIINSGALAFENLEGSRYARESAGYADIVFPFDTVRIINVHLTSTGVKNLDMEVEPTREEWVEKSKFVAKKIAGSDKSRAIQGKHILEWVRSSPHPVILAGDFNSVPGGNLYARLLWLLDDPYLTKGHGAWGSYMPLREKGLPLRIDWTLVDERLPYNGQYIDDIEFSDHRPLVTTFSASNEPEED